MHQVISPAATLGSGQCGRKFGYRKYCSFFSCEGPNGISDDNATSPVTTKGNDDPTESRQERPSK